jgi:hypothetical protein
MARQREDCSRTEMAASAGGSYQESQKILALTPNLIQRGSTALLSSPDEGRFKILYCICIDDSAVRDLVLRGKFVECR